MLASDFILWARVLKKINNTLIQIKGFYENYWWRCKKPKLHQLTNITINSLQQMKRKQCLHKKRHSTGKLRHTEVNSLPWAMEKKFMAVLSQQSEWLSSQTLAYNQKQRNEVGPSAVTVAFSACSKNEKHMVKQHWATNFNLHTTLIFFGGVAIFRVVFACFNQLFKWLKEPCLQNSFLWINEAWESNSFYDNH